MDNLSAQATGALPRMSGDGPMDLLRLRQLSDGFVRPVRETPGHMGLLRCYIYHCTSDRSLAPSTVAGRMAAISDWHRSLLPHLRLAGCLAVNPCKDESIGALVAILKCRITQLGAVRVLFNAELGCRYIRLRVDVQKNVDDRHECFA
eukprot:jgi/Tetstr1/457856/TSEL_004258.t1